VVLAVVRLWALLDAEAPALEPLWGRLCTGASSGRLAMTGAAAGVAVVVVETGAAVVVDLVVAVFDIGGEAFLAAVVDDTPDFGFADF